MRKNKTLDEIIKENLKKPDFKKAWEESEAQYQVTRELIKNRLEQNLSQRDLANMAGTTQTVISRIENMSVNPSVQLLDRLARALEKNLQIRFVSS